MKLRDLVEELSLPSAREELAELEITRICAHSGECSPDCIFVCISGHKDSGENHLEEAISRGARVVVVSKRRELGNEIYQIVSDNTRKYGAEIAKLLYRNVFNSIKFIFITGTKGKTTTAKMLATLLSSAHMPAGVVGTLGIEFGSYRVPTANTTPDLFSLLEPLEAMRRRGARYVILEVSSQALKDGRIDGLRGDIAIYTGISPDHVDPGEHPSFADYALSKRRLFSDFGVHTAFAVRNAPLCDWMLCGVENCYFVHTKRASDLTLKILKMSKSDVVFTDGKRQGSLSMGGEFNLQNAALALLCASRITALDCSFFYPALSSIRICGRLETFRALGREVVIDYAHNAQSVRAIASLFRPLCSGRLIAVIGSVGDRARGRRRELSRACEECFDLTVLTEDDTFGECAEKIVEELFSHFECKERALCVVPREMAILRAFSSSCPEDTVLLLGKGHERTLMRHGVRIPFDERAIIGQIESGKYGKI